MGEITTVDLISIAFSVVAAIFSLITYRNSIIHDRRQIADIATDPRSKEYKEISAYIARVEHFCVGVTQKIYDRKTVYELAHGYFDGAVRDRVEPIIEKKNQSGNDYYGNIHSVYDWMEKETQKRMKKRK